MLVDPATLVTTWSLSATGRAIFRLLIIAAITGILAAALLLSVLAAGQSL